MSMLVTTNRKRALAHAGNRAEARKIIARDGLDDVDEETLEQWIDDEINDWVNELRAERGLGLLEEREFDDRMAEEQQTRMQREEETRE